MTGRNPRTSRILLLLVILMCLALGGMVTQISLTDPSGGDSPDMFVAEDVQELPDTSSDVAADENTGEEAPAPTEEPEATPEPTAEPTKAPDAEPDYEVSPEAETGVWMPSGSNWTFLVDGVPYTGWLNDTDGHRYYFNSDGIMETGWTDVENKRYYFDADGIMQTGDVTYKDKTYHLLEDGSLEGYDVAEAKKKKEEKEAAEQAAEEKAAAEEAAEKAKAQEETNAAEAKASEEKQADKYLALTFDDGPGAYTDRLLDCLETNSAKATFFLVGQEIANYPDAVSRMATLGCEIGSHSYTHIDLTLLSAEDMTAELWATDQEIAALAGHEATLVRPPYGNINDTVSSNVGKPMILWTVDTLDWETQDTEQVTAQILENAADGSIILLHDIYESTVAAAEAAIPKLIEQGYQLVTVSELASIKGVELQAGVSYNNFNAS